MPNARFVGAVTLLLVAAFAAGACGDSNDANAPGGAGADNQGGVAGKGTTPGTSGDGGAGPDCDAEPDSDACREVPWCGPFAITEFCGPTPFPLCPSSLANLVERTPCDTLTSLEVYDTTCGGQVLLRTYPDRTESWEFDKSDAVVGVQVSKGSLHTCFEGGRSLSWLYGGDPCKIDEASKVDACAAQGGNGTGGAPAVDPVATGGAGGAP